MMICVNSIIFLSLLAFTICPVYAADKFRVAFPTLGPGSTPSWVTLEVGMWKKYDLDVKFLAVGETPTGRLSALKAGLIQGTMFTPPLDLVASRDGLKILTKVDVPTLGGGINTTPAFVQQNRKTLINFLKGYMEGIQYMAAHKPESLKVFFKYFKNPDTAAMVYLYDETMPRIEKTLRPSPEAVRYFLDQLAIDDPRVKQLSETDHWNLSLLDEIQQSGFLEHLYKP